MKYLYQRVAELINRGVAANDIRHKLGIDRAAYLGARSRAAQMGLIAITPPPQPYYGRLENQRAINVEMKQDWPEMQFEDVKLESKQSTYVRRLS